MTVDPLIQSLKGKLVVSVQAYMGEPLRHPETMAQMATPPIVRAPMARRSRIPSVRCTRRVCS